MLFIASGAFAFAIAKLLWREPFRGLTLVVRLPDYERFRLFT
jgi:hypothetical protein